MVRGDTGDPPADWDAAAVCLGEMAGIRLLTLEEETRLAEAASAGDRRAAVQLVEANLRVVVSVARRYQDRGVPFLDLVHEGSLGLVRAAGTFDSARSCRFATYAYWCVRRAVRDAVAERDRLVPLPPAAVEAPSDGLVLDRLRVDVHAILLVLTPRERRVLQLRYGLVDGRPLTQGEIGRRLGISRQRVCQIEQIALARVRSARRRPTF